MHDLFILKSDLRILIPIVAIFIIIFGIVFSTLNNIKGFADSSPARAIIALCITVLAIYGLDLTLIKYIVSEYTTMGVIMLVTLASFLLIMWLKILRR